MQNKYTNMRPPTAPPCQATVYVYELVEGEVKVDKLEFSKVTSGSGSGGL